MSNKSIPEMATEVLIAVINKMEKIEQHIVFHAGQGSYDTKPFNEMIASIYKNIHKTILEQEKERR